MTPCQRIDHNLNRILKAAGSGLEHYTLPSVMEELRSAMRDIMSESYIAGSDACYRAMQEARRR